MHPEQVGPYLVEGKLGAGGMGTVYLGRHRETGQLAAVKVLPASLAREEGFVARFDREIEAMAKVSNPHVVKLYESGTDGETYYYSMEYVDGDTLTGRLRKEKRLPWREAIDVAVQICTALKAAHDSGIVHRDLKPSNLMIGKDGTVKLTDFGVAQVFAGTRLTRTGGIVGTAEYMSPEQAQGQRATKKSDLYSLGAVLYVMLTGRPPFSGKTTVEVIQKHRFGQFDRPRTYVPDMPFWLDEIVCQLLEKDPDKRFPDAYVVQRKLQEVVAKVELSQQTQTLAVADVDATAETSVLQTGPGGVPVGSGPGAGTLMRDLLRAEIEHQQQNTRLGRVFDNTWVLVGLLAAVVIGVAVWAFRGAGSDEDRFAQARALLEQPAGEEWFRARDEFLLPLVEADAEKWRDKVEPLLRQVERYELESRVAKPRRGSRTAAPRSEPERLLLLAESRATAGDDAGAESLLQGLVDVLDGQKEHAAVREVAEKRLADLRERTPAADERTRMLAESLERAQKLSESGDVAGARRTYRGVVALYADDPRATDFVQQARTALDRLPTAAAETGGTSSASESVATDRTAPTETSPAPADPKTSPAGGGNGSEEGTRP